MLATVRLLSPLGWALSPTRRIIDLLKEGDGEHRGRALRRWSVGLFAVEVVGLLALSMLWTIPPSRALGFISLLLLIYSASRINEIAYAFVRDPLSSLKESDLSSVDRIKMAMRSYFGLAFNFAVVFYALPIPSLFKDELSSFFEAFYFSGVTLATLGYGDILPLHWVARALALYEVATGILIVAVAIATYISGVKASDA